MYKVIKDEKEIAEYQVLSAAKKKADAESAEVFCNGKKVYPIQKVIKYCLKALMNIRSKPSMDAPILGTQESGTVVDVKAVKDDWLCLSDRTYVLYGKGEFACIQS